MRFLYLMLAVLMLNGCAMKQMEYIQAMGEGRQDEYIQKFGGTAAFETLDSENLEWLCSMYGTSGKPRSFIDCRETYIRRFSGSDDPKTQFYVLDGYERIALTEISLGHYENATTAIDTALGLFGERGALKEHWIYGTLISTTEIELYALRALVAHHHGDTEKKAESLAFVEESKAWLFEQTSEESVEQEKVGKLLAKVYLAMEMYDEAAEVAAEARTKNHEFPKESEFIKVLDAVMTFGLSLAVDAVMDSSMEKLQNVLENQEKQWDTSLYYQARAELEGGRYENALDTFKKLEVYTSMTTDPVLHWRYWYDYARTHIALGDPAKAVTCLKHAIEVIESQRADFNSEMGKIGFSADKQHVYNLTIKTLMNSGRYQEAFAYTERAKARSLIDLLAARENFELGKTGQAARYLAQLRKEELKPIAYEAPGIKKRTAAKSIQGQLKSEYPELASLVTVETLTSEQVGQLLKKDEVLVEYYVAGEDLFAFIVAEDRFEAFVLNGKGLTEDVRLYRQALMRVDNSWRAPSARLYKRLIRPIEKQIAGKQVVIVPHGPLHYLPFTSLRGGRSYLVDNAQIRFMPSASVMTYLGQNSQPSESMLILGNPDLDNPAADLPGAEDEARAIAKLWPNGQMLLRKQASESLLKDSTGLYSKYHIASHGEFNPDSPLDSRLLLAADGTNDGQLTVGEIYGLKLNADLVTLSACETGLGDISKGDDVVGLTRGFLYAGADSIVASLWQVHDEPTAHFMKAFYSGLKKTDKASALRIAQLDTRKRYPHPAHWAAFQLTGTSH